jgi:hypothetical protein
MYVGMYLRRVRIKDSVKHLKRYIHMYFRFPVRVRSHEPGHPQDLHQLPILHENDQVAMYMCMMYVHTCVCMNFFTVSFSPCAGN